MTRQKLSIANPPDKKYLPLPSPYSPRCPQGSVLNNQTWHTCTCKNYNNDCDWDGCSIAYPGDDCLPNYPGKRWSLDKVNRKWVAQGNLSLILTDHI